MADYLDELDWRQRASCTQHEPELWHPDTKLEHSSAWDAPRAICRACPVIAECLAWALEHDEREGMYGGRTPQERGRIKRGRRRNPYSVETHGTEAGYARHRRRGEKPCRPCIDGAVQKKRERERRAKAGAA